MGGFFSRRKGAVRLLPLREPTAAGHAVEGSQILLSLAGAALIALAPDPAFSPLILGFVSCIIGLFVTGCAEFVPNAAAVYRASLRVLGLVLVTPMMVALLALALRELGG